MSGRAGTAYRSPAADTGEGDEVLGDRHCYAEGGLSKCDVLSL